MRIAPDTAPPLQRKKHISEKNSASNMDQLRTAQKHEDKRQYKRHKHKRQYINSTERRTSIPLHSTTTNIHAVFL